MIKRQPSRSYSAVITIKDADGNVVDLNDVEELYLYAYTLPDKIIGQWSLTTGVTGHKNMEVVGLPAEGKVRITGDPQETDDCENVQSYIEVSRIEGNVEFGNLDGKRYEFIYFTSTGKRKTKGRT